MCQRLLGPAFFRPNESVTSEIFCNGTSDGISCWPATPVNTTAERPCPTMMFLDPDEFSSRHCSAAGVWTDRDGGVSTGVGWSNYSRCYTSQARHVEPQLFGSHDRAELKRIGHCTLIMDLVGLSLSFVFVLVSIFIFFYYRTRICNRIRIHRNLFVAILIHVTIRLVAHLDWLFEGIFGQRIAGTSTSRTSIHRTPGVCEALIALGQYSKTVMFLWMFLEGLYLHNMIVVSVFSGPPDYRIYHCVAWGSPMVLTFAWSLANFLLKHQVCWPGYTFTYTFWIMEGPRAAVIAVNIIFLLNIIRVLVTKLRVSNSTETVQVRKAVRAAIILLPLLGVINFMEMVNPIKMSSIGAVATWWFASRFLSSFQGFFIAILYCFCNSEVQKTIKAHYHRYRRRQFYSRRRFSRNFSIFTSFTEVNGSLPKSGRSSNVRSSGTDGHCTAPNSVRKGKGYHVRWDPPPQQSGKRPTGRFGFGLGPLSTRKQFLSGNIESKL